MRILILLLIAILYQFDLFSQTRAYIDIKSSDFSDTLSNQLVIWDLDWENKIIYERPTIRDVSNNILISLESGDYALEYRSGDRIYSIYNLHIDSNISYYRYTIYYGYLDYKFDGCFLDSVFVKSTYFDF